MSSATTQTEKVFTQIRSQIVDGCIVAGTKLSEMDLAREFSVSRAVIREAINRLEACRLVSRRPNVGAKVVELSCQGLTELYQAREALEGMAARLAARYMSKREISELESHLTSHLDAIERKASYYQAEGDDDFHYRIIKASKNTQLISLLCDELYYLVRLYRVQLGMTGPHVAASFADHQHISRAIASRDEELAEMLMRRHIQATFKIQLEKLSTASNKILMAN